MYLHEESDNYVYEKLYGAVMKSITSSQEVKKILQDLQAKGGMDKMAVMNVILSLEELSALMQPNSNLEKQKAPDLTSEELKLSYKGDFDETQWLKKVGIRF